MKTKYIINKNEMIVNLDCLYKLQDDPINIKNIRKYINNLIKNENICFYGNKIIIYKNNLLIGTFYLVNYYLNIFYNKKRKLFLSSENSFFYETTYTEMIPKKKIKCKKNN